MDPRPTPTPDPGPEAAERRTIPREHDAPRGLIVLMIALMLLAVGGAFIWIEHSGTAEHILGRPAPLARDGPIYTIEEVLAESSKANLLGRDVAIWSAPVTHVDGDWLFWIGPDPRSAVPVVLMGEQTGRQDERQTEVRDGDLLAIFGFVRAVGEISFLDQPWALRPEIQQRLSRSQVYISALRVEHLARTD